MHSLDTYYLHVSFNSPIMKTKLTCKLLSSQHQQLHLHGKRKSYLAFGSSKVIANTPCRYNLCLAKNMWLYILMRWLCDVFEKKMTECFNFGSIKCGCMNNVVERSI